MSALRIKRVIFLNRYFFPDHSATSQILSDLTFQLAGTGYDVHVITSRQRYDEPGARLPEFEIVRGVTVHRVSTTNFGRSALLGRGFDYFSFYLAMWRSLASLLRADDIVVAKTDPPLLCLLASLAAKRGHGHLVNWLQDLYPEVASKLGVPMLRGPIGQFLSYLRDNSLKAASVNVVVGDLMADNVHSLGIGRDQILVIPNWCDDDVVRPISSADNPLRKEWGLEDKFVVGYSGNLGRAHDFGTVLAAAERLRDDPRIIFLFIGGGHKFDELQRCVAARDLGRSFRFMPYQDQVLLKYSLGVPDLHWVSLNPKLEGLIVPSKFYGIAAAGRPVIAITAQDGEIARLIERHQCGLVIEPGNAEALAEALRTLSSQPQSLAAMGQRARQMLDENFTRAHAFARWGNLLNTMPNTISLGQPVTTSAERQSQPLRNL